MSSVKFFKLTETACGSPMSFSPLAHNRTPTGLVTQYWLMGCKQKIQVPTLGPKRDCMLLFWLFPLCDCPQVNGHWNRDGSNTSKWAKLHNPPRLLISGQKYDKEKGLSFYSLYFGVFGRYQVNLHSLYISKYISKTRS